MKTTMQSRINKSLLILMLFIFGYGTGNSQIKTDSLTSYIETAIRNNPVVLQRYAEYEAALRKVPQAGSLPDPELSTGIFLSPMELVEGRQVADIRLMQMFPWFGTLKSARDEMSMMAKARYETFLEVKLQTIFDVQSTWYEMNKVNLNIRVSGKYLDLLRTIEKLAIARFKAASLYPVPAGQGMPAGTSTDPGTSSDSQGMTGMSRNQGSRPLQTNPGMNSSMPGNQMDSGSGGSPLTDINRIMIEIGELENNIGNLKNRMTTLTARFNTYLYRNPATPVILPDTIIACDQEIPLVPSDSILSGNPMLEMLKFERKSLDVRKQMITKMGYPMLGLGLNYSLINRNEMSVSDMNGKDMIMPMVTATLPLYRKKYRAMRSEVGLLESANDYNYQASMNSLQAEYYEASQFYLDSKRRMKLYENQILIANSTFEIMLRSFAASGAQLTELLRLRQQLLDYKYKQTEAVADLNTAVAWIKKLSANSENK